MKTIFKALQKSNMRKLKEENRRVSSGVAAQRSPKVSDSKGFVTDCLVKVKLKEKWTESSRKKLMVHVCDSN